MFSISTMLALSHVSALAAVPLWTRPEPTNGGIMLPRRKRTRRWLLGALAALVAATPLGAGHGAKAADNVSTPHPDHGSKAAFELECALLGGTFVGGDLLGATYCYTDDGTIKCDTNGNNCTFTPIMTSWQPPSGVGSQYDGSVDQVAASDEGAQTSDPVADDDPFPSTDQGAASPADDQRPKVKAKHGKHKKGKKHRHGRNRRN